MIFGNVKETSTLFKQMHFIVYFSYFFGDFLFIHLRDREHKEGEGSESEGEGEVDSPVSR